MTKNPHMITTYWTAFGWTWECACGTGSKGIGAYRTQTAAYSGGERHIRTALKAARS